MELAVQVDFGAHTTVQKKKPDGGFFILVADAVPAGASAAKVTIYRGRLGKAEQIGEAIREVGDRHELEELPEPEWLRSRVRREELVEPRRIELLTFSLRTRRSPS